MRTNAEDKPLKILREKIARERFGVGRTKFARDFRPRLQEIRLGPRAFGYLEQDVDVLIKQLIAESSRGN